MAEANLIKSADLAKVSAIDFVESFHENINALMQALGLTRKIEKKPGQVIKTYKVVGKIESGVVGEGEDIPLSHFETEVADMFELSFRKWRKQTSFEAIAEKGYKQAVTDGDDEMLKQIQGGVRKQFFDFVKTGKGTASGKDLRDALAQTRAQLVLATEDYGLTDSDFIYIMNPLDTADYLGKESNHTTQSAYGMTFLKGFLNAYDVIERSDIPKGTIAATTKNNLIMYYVNTRNSDIAQAFDFISDETGYIGVTRDIHKTNLTTDTVAVTGLEFFAELIDWVFLCTIEPLDGEAAPAVAAYSAPEPAAYEEKDVQDMTVPELKAYAAEHGIDIEGIRLKADIVDAILDAEAAGATAGEGDGE